MMGGIKAVIWNDVTQFCIMMIGLTMTIIIVLVKVEGGASAIFSNFFQEGIGNIPNPDIDTSNLFGKALSYFSIPLVLPAIILGWLFRLVGFTGDQVMIQRFSTAKTMRQARRGFVITAISDLTWMTLLFFVGLALFTYLRNGEALPEWVSFPAGLAMRSRPNARRVCRTPRSDKTGSLHLASSPMPSSTRFCHTRCGLGSPFTKAMVASRM